MENEKRFDVEVASPLESDKLIEMAQAAEKRIEAVRKIKTMALKLTNAHDWTDQGGKPYLQVSGAEKIARLFGISWRFMGDIERQNEEDGHFSYHVSMEFVMSGASVEFRGSRSSKDPFFAKKHGKDIPPSEIDKTDVMKAAITNTIGNGITRLLGIRNLTWKDLEDAGIKQKEVSRVDYRSNGKEQQGTGTETPTEIIGIARVESKSGKTKDNKPWTLYTLISGNRSFNTFDKKCAEIAEQSIRDKVNVVLCYSDTPKGLKVESIQLEPPSEASEES